MPGVGGTVLVFGGVFYFKDYNTAIQISGKKLKFKCFWWLAPQKTGNGTFLGN